MGSSMNVFSSPKMARAYVDSVTRSAAPRRTRRQDSAWPVVVFIIALVVLAGMVR